MTIRAVTPFSRHLRRALLAFLLAGVAGLLALQFFNWQREQREVRDNLLIQSGFLASATQAFFDDLGHGLEPLGQLLEELDVLGEPEKARAPLNRFQARYPEIGAMAVIDPGGRMLINTASAPGGPLPDLGRDPAYFAQVQAAIADSAPYTIGRPEFGKILHQWRFPFRFTVRNDEGRPLFLIQGAIPLEKRGIFLYDFPLPPHSLIGLLREDGYQQARWPAADPNEVYAKRSSGPLAQLVQTNPELRSGHFTGYSPWMYTDKERLGAFTHLPRSAMYAYVSVPMSYVWGRWWEHNAPVLVVFSVFVLTLGLVAYRVTVHERRHSQELISQARHDTLSGLPNRAGAEELLERLIRDCQTSGRLFSVMFFDLDRFKDINDTLGHGVGDQLLADVGRRVRELLRQDDTLARLGGDEFLAMLPGSTATTSVGTAERIISALREPFEILGHRLQVTCSIGIATYPEHGSDRNSLLKHADTAMYEAKRQGRSRLAFYLPELGEQVQRRLALQSLLREAVDTQEFTLHFQPIVDLSSGATVAAEALLRWRDGRGVHHSPAEFIPIAEECGLILPIGEWVLRTACEQAKRWHELGFPIRLAVNLSTRQFQDPRLLERVRAVLADTGIDPGHLELEVTESAAMLDPESSMRVLGALKGLGIEIGIDDFGTGYSSLSYLKRIPADTIKIDRSFVEGVCNDPDDTAIVRAILALAASMDKHTVAEGIETEAQRKTLLALGCVRGQGYHFSRPVDAAQFGELLLQSERRSGKPASDSVAH
jgi:diguanylate cyclase (GGDEF)-like protein